MIFSLIAFSIFPKAWAADAAGSTGMIAAMRGDAWALSADNTRRDLFVKAPVFISDTLATGKRGRLQILFDDDTIISMGPDSTLMLRDYHWEGEAMPGRIETEVKEGFFKIMGGRIAKESPENFKTRTGVATIGIRGSVYALSYLDETLQVVFLGGTGIDVVNDKGRVAILKPGFGTTVFERNTAPEKPRRFSRSDLKEILKQTANDMGGSRSSEEGDENTGTASEQGDDSKKSEADGTVARDEDSRKFPSQTSDMRSGIDSARSAVDNEVTDRSQFVLYDTISEDHDTADPVAMAGSYLSLLVDPSAATDFVTFDGFGVLEGRSIDGHFSGDGLSGSGEAFTFELTLPTYSPGGIYEGRIIEQQQVAAFPMTGVDSTDIDMDVLVSSLGEFGVIQAPGKTSDTSTEGPLYVMTGFFGVPSPAENRPEEVMYTYEGPATGFVYTFDESYTEAGPLHMTMKVNWHNNTYMGKLSAGDHDLRSPLTFFGHLDPDPATTGETFFYQRLTPSPTADQLDGVADNASTEPGDFSPINWLTGRSNDFGTFYGTAYQGFGATATGELASIQSDQVNASGEWHFASGVFCFTQTETPLTGTRELTGFVSGIGENMEQPDLDRRFFLNRHAGEFSLTVDRDSGELTGVLGVRDVAGDAELALQIGGAFGSAYVDDSLMVALLGGQVTRSGVSGPLKSYGNILEMATQEEAVAEYLSWGYWEAAYADPITGEPYHVHVPASLWVAGDTTPEGVVQDLITSAFTGAYEGRAIGTMTYPGQTDLESMEGSISLNIDFSPASASPVAGQIAFPDQNLFLSLENGQVGPGGFNAGIADTLSGELNGGFFGPGAESVGGNFNAFLDSERTLTGVFGADLK